MVFYETEGVRQMIVMWAFCYSAVYQTASRLSAALRLDAWLTAGAMLLYTLCFVSWIFLREDRLKIGVCLGNTASYLRNAGFWGAVILPVCNLLAADRYALKASDIVMLLSVSAAEEIFFRGYLLEYLKHHGITYGIMGTSLLFSLLHMVNWNPDSDIVYIGLQMLCAFFSSICYCVTVLQTGSLLPCVGLHFLTNITGSAVFSERGGLSAGILSILLYICWGVFMIVKISRKKEI